MKKQSMSMEVFLERLRNTRDLAWRVEVPSGVIRCGEATPFGGDSKGTASIGGRYYCCPVTAIEEGRLHPFGFREAARKLGLNFRRGCRIISASDNGSGHDKKLRKQMLEVLGLEEKK